MFWRKKDSYTVNDGKTKITPALTKVTVSSTLDLPHIPLHSVLNGVKIREDPDTVVITEGVEDIAIPGTSSQNGADDDKEADKEPETSTTSSAPAQNGAEDDDQADTDRRVGAFGGPIKHREIVKYPKNKEEKAAIKTALLSNDFLGSILKEASLDAIIDAMAPKAVAAGEVIIAQGDDGNHMFVSDSGSYEIIINGKLFSTFNDKRIFGELGILYKNPRLATIKSKKKGRIWELHRSDYQQIMMNNAIQENEAILSFLRNVPGIIQKASPQKLNKIASLLKKAFYPPGTEIVKQGDEGDKFYIIKIGTTTVSKKGQGVVATLTSGQFFGEKALLENDVRTATVTANAPGVECLYLSRTEFHENIDFGQIGNDERESVENIKTEYADITMDQLTRIKTLGVGGFGRVELVQTSDKKLKFALKYLKKQHVIEKDQQEHAINEKIVQMTCNSDFIVRLYRTYQDRKYLYYLQESCLGGDLFTLLQYQPKKCFNEDNAKFFAACILEALAYLHSKNFIYRDLKPENMLIDSQGYVKLTDFGFAKKLLANNKTFTFAGTPEYVAPEIVYNRGHDKAVDYWAFGIFIYELLVGRTPFRTNDQTYMKTYSLILKGIDTAKFPSKMPKNAEHLIKKLCRSMPNERLGCQKNGAMDIRNHNWFDGKKFWDKLSRREIRSNFVPKAGSWPFDSFPEDNEIPQDVEGDNWDKFD